MTDYRAYTVGLDGRFISFEPLVCRDDDEATAKAQRLLDGHDVEVWNGARFVIRLDHIRKYQAQRLQLIMNVRQHLTEVAHVEVRPADRAIAEMIGPGFCDEKILGTISR